MTNKWVLEQARMEALGKLAAVEAQRDVLLGVAKSLVSLEELASARGYKDWQVIAELVDIVDAARSAIARVQGR